MAGGQGVPHSRQLRLMTVFYNSREYSISLKEKLTDGTTGKKAPLIFHSGDGLLDALSRRSGECRVIVLLPPPERPCSIKSVVGYENIRRHWLLIMTVIMNRLVMLLGATNCSLFPLLPPPSFLPSFLHPTHDLSSHLNFTSFLLSSLS